MNECLIKLGDTVEVYTAQGVGWFSGTVRNIPQQSGEAWIIQEPDGAINYVQVYGRIKKPA